MLKEEVLEDRAIESLQSILRIILNSRDNCKYLVTMLHTVPFNETHFALLQDEASKCGWRLVAEVPFGQAFFSLTHEVYACILEKL